MLTNIFLFVGKNLHDLDQLNIYNYPTELINIEQTDVINKIILSHDKEVFSLTKDEIPSHSSEKQPQTQVSKIFLIETPIPQMIDGLNIYTTCINREIILGLILDKDDNPYDYKDIFRELLNELLNNEKLCKFEDEIEIENFLITVFIDLRRFGDEFIEKRPEIDYPLQEMFVKVFLFGIDDVGKTSLVRKIRTGQFNDNFFMPTKKFNIEYFQAGKKGTLAFWDMPGQIPFRKKWLIGLQDSNILIFMIDIANQRRFEESKNEFWKIINRYDLAQVPLIILGNKIDLFQISDENPKNQIPRLKKEIIDYYEFNKIHNRKWKLLFTSVKTSFNIDLAIKSIFDLI